VGVKANAVEVACMSRFGAGGFVQVERVAGVSRFGAGGTSGWCESVWCRCNERLVWV